MSTVSEDGGPDLTELFLGVHSRSSAVCGRCVIRHPYGIGCSPDSTRDSSRNDPDPATPLALDGAAEGVSDGGNRTGTSEARDAPLVRGADRGSRGTATS